MAIVEQGTKGPYGSQPLASYLLQWTEHRRTVLFYLPGLNVWVARAGIWEVFYYFFPPFPLMCSPKKNLDHA